MPSLRRVLALGRNEYRYLARLYVTVAAAIFFLWGAAPPTAADTILQYTGMSYNTPPFAGYTDSMSISGTITLAPGVTLPPNSFINPATHPAALSAWSFSDGLVHYDQTNSAFLSQDFISTDATGQINAWSLSLAQNTDEPLPGICIGAGPGFGGCNDFLPPTFSDVVGQGELLAASLTPGSWSIVPEPTTLMLTALGLCLLRVISSSREGSA